MKNNKTPTTTIYYGLHTVKALLTRRANLIKTLWVGDQRQDQRIIELIELALKANLKIEYGSRQQLNQLTHTEQHQNIAVSCNALPEYHEDDLLDLLPADNTLVLILDGLQDPHNLGACLRSAEAAGVDVVIAPKHQSVGITPVVRKVASGAAEWIPFIQVTNLVRTLETLKEQGIWLWGTAGEADTTVYETDLSTRVAIVLGAEGRGLRRLTREHCDGLMRIPLWGAVESLNVSVACGICLFEARRQQGNLPQ